MQVNMSAARRLAQLPERYADGGAVGFGARGLSQLRELVPKVAAMGFPQQAQTPAPAPVSDPRAAQLMAMIPQMEAMGFKQKPQMLARGGMVRGPGTGTSDSIPDEAEPGTYIMPADSTAAIGPSALEKMGTVPVRLSDGEMKLPPEQVMAIGEAVLKLMKDATHTPVNGEDGGQTDAEVEGDDDARGFNPADRMAQMPEQMYADGGMVDPNRPRSFGDAAAVANDPTTTQVRTSAMDSFGRPPAAAPVAAPAPALGSNLAAVTRMGSFTDPRSTMYDSNPYAASNAAKMAASGQSSRATVEAGMAPAPQPATASNSFGDASAATRDAGVTQVAGYQPGRGTVSTVPAQPMAAPRPPAAPALAASPAAGFQTAAQLMAAPTPAPAPVQAAAPAAPMGWQARQDQRSAEVAAASITNRPEWSRAQPRRYADGGMVEDDLQKRLMQIPTGGMQAPQPDGSQNNPLNTEIGRNAMNTLSALPGAGGLASRGGAQVARAATGGAASAERAIPAAWEVVQDGGSLVGRAASVAPAAGQIGRSGGGALTRAASMSQGAPQAALSGPGGQLATRAAGEIGEAAAGFAPRARTATQWADVVEPAALGAPTMGQGAAAAGQAAPSAARGFGRYAAGAAGLGGAALLAGSSGDSGANQAAQSMNPSQPSAQPTGAQPTGAVQQGPATVAMAQMPIAQNAITRTGNSYTGPANISGDVMINGAAPGGGAISAQNMAAADALAGRQAQESLARVLGQMPNSAQGVQVPTIRTSANDWQSRNDLRNLEVSASSITNNGGRFDPTGGRNPAALAYRAALETDNALRASAPGLAQQAMREQGDTQRAGLQVTASGLNAAADRQNALERTLIGERGANARAGLSAAATLDAAKVKANAAGQKPLTEDQAKSAGYALRMDNALKLINEIGAKNPGATRPGFGTALLNTLPEGAANFLRPEQRQQVEAAQLDALDAALTLNTGAAYTREQLQGLSRAYFAQPGDDDATVADKQRRLGSLIETARVRAGSGGTGMIDAVQAKQAQPPQTAAGSQAPQSLPSGMSRQVGTSGGRPVYEDAQGNRFIGG